MHYYKRHLGDYARDTGHLTALEHGIYTLLLDWYYVNERPISADKAVRIARGNPEETRMVLEEYFELTDEGWRHHYADREIAEYQKRSEHNRDVGKLGGRPKRTQTVSEREPGHNPQETQTVSEREPVRNPQETLTTNHKPLTKNQEPKEKKTTRQSLRDDAAAMELLADIPADLLADFKQIRKAKKAPLTATAVKGLIRECGKAGLTLRAGIEMCCERGWSAIKAEWLAKPANGQPTPQIRTRPLL